jgi:hypothetical protein
VTIELTTEQKDLRRTVRELVRNKINLLDSLPEAPLPRDVSMGILKMVEPFGVLSARVPEEDGGFGSATSTSARDTRSSRLRSRWRSAPTTSSQCASGWADRTG